MKDDSFVSQGNLFWFWFASALLAVLTLGYLIQDPVGGSNGGTVFGYTSGTVAAITMVFLMWYAGRKRAYASTVGTLKGWLGAHVWVGMALIAIVPLHSGFSFNWNVHTLCYVLIVLTILTGIWGMGMYLQLPPQMQARRAGISTKSALREMSVLATDIASLGKGKSEAFLRLQNLLDQPFEPNIFRIILTKRSMPDLSVAPETVAQLAALPVTEQDDGLKIVSMVHRRAEIGNKLLAEVRLAALLRLWLYLHLPIAVGAMTLLVVHIISVFYRW